TSGAKPAVKSTIALLQAVALESGAMRKRTQQNASAERFWACMRAGANAPARTVDIGGSVRHLEVHPLAHVVNLHAHDDVFTLKFHRDTVGEPIAGSDQE